MSAYADNQIPPAPIQPQPQYQPMGTPHPNGGNLVRVSDRTKLAAGLLALFLGGIGIHRFYLGKSVSGVFYLLFFWTFIPSIIAFVEALILLSTNDRDFDAKYNYAYR